MLWTAHIRTISRNSWYHARARTAWPSARLIVEKTVSESALWLYSDSSIRALCAQSTGWSSRCLISGLTPSSQSSSSSSSVPSRTVGKRSNSQQSQADVYIGIAHQAAKKSHLLSNVLFLSANNDQLFSSTRRLSELYRHL